MIGAPRAATVASPPVMPGSKDKLGCDQVDGRPDCSMRGQVATPTSANGAADVKTTPSG